MGGSKGARVLLVLAVLTLMAVTVVWLGWQISLLA
jgi:hypothetical protein